MKVLLTGADGYLGSVTAPRLTAGGHTVTGLDTALYEGGCLYHLGADRPAVVRKDVRDVDVEDLVGFDAVVHMAELSNDPLAQLAPALTEEINHLGSLRLAAAAKEAGVARFVYMSSCSVYGTSAGGIVDETSDLHPQTAYARCKVLVERDVVELADERFTPVFLRNATAFGASPRMRFDIVLNNLAGLAWSTGEIRMTSDGSPWRPMVHADDIAGAIEAVLAAPTETVHGEIFNVGAPECNHQIRDIAEVVGKVFPDCVVTLGDSRGDNRSYRVSFDKIRRQLPGFSPAWTVEDGARQLRAVFERVGLTAALFGQRDFTRLRQLEHLLATGQLDPSLRWVEP